MSAAAQVAPAVTDHTEIELDENGQQRRTHIVNCPADKASTVAWLAEAAVEGLEVEALCGHRWVPVRDPRRFPICQACVDAAGIIIAEVTR